MTRYASHFLYLSPDNYLKQYVVELREGCVYRIFPLKEEIESTCWIGDTIILSASTIVTGSVSVDADGYIKSEVSIYAYQVSADGTLKQLL